MSYYFWEFLFGVLCFYSKTIGGTENYNPSFLKKNNYYREISCSLLKLYDRDEKYKQGPNGEEKGEKIHRMPVFIINRDGKESARIVESS